MKICDLCGKKFDDWDREESFGMDYWCGYDSKHAGEHIQFDFCCDCFDELLDTYIIPKVRAVQEGNIMEVTHE